MNIHSAFTSALIIEHVRHSLFHCIYGIITDFMSALQHYTTFTFVYIHYSFLHLLAASRSRSNDIVNTEEELYFVSTSLHHSSVVFVKLTSAASLADDTTALFSL